MADVGVNGGDKYRSYLTEEDLRTTNWKAGPPNYDLVNKLFEEGRTKSTTEKIAQNLPIPPAIPIWPVGSLEERVQNLVKTWEMERVHKVNPRDYKTLDPQKFVSGINGKRFFTIEEIAKVGGGYNVFLQTSLPPSLRFYDPDQETYDSSQTAFKTTFPRGFALEVLQVYSGPPVICYKFRHWGYMEGPFKGHEPTGELVELFGTAVFELDGFSKIVKAEFFCDRGELLSSLMKGKKSDESASKAPSASGCPFMA